MNRSRHSGHIRPKISTMPRPKTEATLYLDAYKLAVERERLQQELQSIEQRREQIQQRLVQLDHQINALDNGVQQIRETSQTPTPLLRTMDSHALEGFNTIFLEY